MNNFQLIGYNHKCMVAAEKLWAQTGDADYKTMAEEYALRLACCEDNDREWAQD